MIPSLQLPISKGWGRFCQSLCQDLTGFCSLEPERKLNSLDPYDHFHRTYRLCETHLKRNINDLKFVVSQDIRLAMLSLLSPNPLANYEETLEKIRSGGPKAKGLEVITLITEVLTDFHSMAER